MKQAKILSIGLVVLGTGLSRVLAQSTAASQRDRARPALPKPDVLRLDLIRDTGDSVIPGKWILAFHRDAGDPVAEGGLGYGYDDTGFVRVPAGLPEEIVAIEPLELRNVHLYAEESQRTGVKKVYEPLLPTTFAIDVDGDEKTVIERLRARPDVRYVEPERRQVAVPCWGTDTPNDPNLGSLWGMQIIGAPTAWALMPSSVSNIRVAVCEGDRVSTTHVDLVAQRVVSGDRHPGSIADHPTHVAGIVAATGDNNEGVVGVANVELVSFEPRTTNLGFAVQIGLAVNDGVDVFNMSFTRREPGDPNNYAPYSQTVQDAIDDAEDAMLFVAAAGNFNTTTDADGDFPYPAAYDYVLGISATGPTDQKAVYSNFGPYVDLSAPGGDDSVWLGPTDMILSTVNVPANGYDWMQGTSMAAPHVSGAGAVLMEVRGLDPREIRNLLRMTATDLGSGGYDETFGSGRLNLAAAVTFPESDRYVSSELGNDYWPYTGTLSLPSATVTVGVYWVPEHGTVGIARGHYPENITISTPCTLRTLGGGSVIVGQ